MILKRESPTRGAFGWAGNILRVDLARESAEDMPSEPYTETYIGGRGFATRLAWEEIEPGIGAFDPENLLMFFAGPLTGTTAPFSGRSIVCALSPQAYPREWFTRSGLGGHWGPELKYAGYDGIVISGRAEKPVYLWVSDGRVELHPADDLWGKGIYETQKVLLARHGQDVRIVTIGPAGENRSRIAVISTETESSAGQGGFGGVMGAKKLKAIAVRGTGQVRIARPESFTERCRLIAAEAHGAHGVPRPWGLKPDLVARYGERHQACTQQCSVKCPFSRYYTNVPGPILGGVNSGQMHCFATIFPGAPDTFYDWKLGFEAGFELSKISNELGINHWDLGFGIMPWLRKCKQEGVLTKVDELEIDLDNPRFWLGVLNKIAYRQGAGEALAEGGLRAAKMLGVGEEFISEFYNSWGSAGHWDGHGDRANRVVFPFWLVSALQWALDTRDPISSGHGYAQNISNWGPFSEFGGAIAWDEIKAIGERLYGTDRASAPDSGYEAKAIPALWHSNRSVLKDSILVDDQVFPRIFSIRTPDRFARAGDMEGPSFEYHMFADATGSKLSEDELYESCDRTFNLDRMVQVRNFGRGRAMDESVAIHFETEENWVNPLLGSKQKLDREKFRALLDEYYALRGWDPATGRPLPETLRRLGLGDTISGLAR